MDQLGEILTAILNATSVDESVIRYLKSTAFSQYVVSTPWVWPLAETLHFLGLALLFGTIGPLDFRLLGFMRHLPVSAFRALVPWAVAGFVLNLATGLVFLVAAPDQYMSNISWWLKVLFLAIAGLNVLLFELTQKATVDALPPGSDTPPILKMIGGVSLVSWFMVLVWGRMLAFLGNAF
jgi:H+/Cl- antiporter ClcA